MQSMLEELYYGAFRSEEASHKQDSPHTQATHLKQRTLEKLMAVLDDSEKELFGKYLDAQEELEEINRYEMFTHSLKFGIQLMAEVLTLKVEY